MLDLQSHRQSLVTDFQAAKAEFDAARASEGWTDMDGWSATPPEDTTASKRASERIRVLYREIKEVEKAIKDEEAS